ncbi:hydroxymethylglutaryl-CoA lyase [Silvibacterium acidisoli]|uniref:hydroxymethylglutaryl-CoA lyase n=1 Tax=Acidobacteriaceae bacterium ZG23-2 TaxID=2883246 RepID=UPI00406CBFE7
MDNSVKLIESPRDAWQALTRTIPAEVKADYLKLLVGAGFRHIDAVSFVSSAEVPQMADSERVLEMLEAPTDVEIIGLALNREGADRAIATGAVTTLAFPYSMSPAFLQRNQRQTPEESLEALDSIGEVAYRNGVGVVAYLSMAFGNPFGDPWDVDELVAACDLLADNGVDQFSLVDSMGTASPELIAEVLEAVGSVLPQSAEVGVHLYARPEEAAEKLASAYRAGCRRFDTSLSGLGTSSFVDDVLAGNIPTEVAVAELTRLGADLPALEPLDSLISAGQAIAQKFGTPLQ